MDSFGKFIRSWSVYSKTAGEPVSAYCNGIKYVFVEGWPMTVSTYSLLTLRCVFGGSANIKDEEWEVLHLETRTLCEGLNLPTVKGEEALSLVRLFGDMMQFKDNTMRSETVVLDWIKILDSAIQDADKETGA